MTAKEWTRIFKGLGNENRLKIVKMLYPDRRMTVSEVKNRLGISFKWTSANLSRLAQLGILERDGRGDRIVYYINPKLEHPLFRLLREFLPDVY